MTKQELIEQGFKYIATQNCEQKTEVWARFTGWEDMIQYWYYFPKTDQTNPGNVNTISFVGQIGLFEIMADEMRMDFLNKDIKYDNTCIWKSSKEDDKPMDLDDFIEEIESAYRDATKRGFDSIVITIDTDLDNTYYINDTEEGFQCDVFDYVFDDLYSIACQLYDELHGNVTDIRVE